MQGNIVPALSAKPVLFEDLIWIWEAFCMLNKCRNVGMMGPDPIPFAEMRSMADELELDSSTRFRFFDRISFIDRVYLEYCQKQAEIKEATPKKKV